MDVANIGHTRFDKLRDSSVKRFRVEARKTFSKHRETYEMLRGLKLGFQARAHVKRYKTSDDFLNLQTKEKSSIVELVLRLSECNNHLNRVGVDLPDEIVMFLQSHCHQAARAS